MPQGAPSTPTPSYVAGCGGTATLLDASAPHVGAQLAGRNSSETNDATRVPRGCVKIAELRRRELVIRPSATWLFLLIGRNRRFVGEQLFAFRFGLGRELLSHFGCDDLLK